MNNLRISRLIAEFRMAHGMSQGDFGALLGVSAQAVSKWERDICYPDVVMLPTLAKVLGVSVGELFEEV